MPADDSLRPYSVVCSVRFSPDGKYLATGCNRTARIFDVETGEKIWYVSLPTHGWPSLICSQRAEPRVCEQNRRFVCPDRVLQPGRQVPRDGWGRQTDQSKCAHLIPSLIPFTPRQIWDIATKQIWHVLDGHQQEIYALEFSRDGRLLVSGSGDSTARVWDLVSVDAPNGPLIQVLTPNETHGIDAGVTSVSISPDGRLVAAGSLDFTVHIWDVASGALVERLRGHKDSVYSVAFTTDGKGLVSGSLDKTLKY